jgi:hypothetical protein
MEDDLSIQGAVYYNGFYPGHIAVLPNSAFRVLVDRTLTMLHIVRHVSPVVVTDFANSLIKEKKDGKTYIFLSQEIPSKPLDTLSTEFSSSKGAKGVFVVTKNHNYKLYRTQSFTEITVGVEVDDIQASNAGSPVYFSKAIDRFLEIYRVVAADGWVQPPTRLRRNYPVIREGHSPYRPDLLHLEPFKRLAEHIPKNFTPIILSYSEFADDLPNENIDINDITERVGHHLAVDTRISAAQEAIIECYETLITTKNHRFAVVEAFSIAEVVSFDFILQMRKQDDQLDQALAKCEMKNRLTMGKIIRAFFPGLFKTQMVAFPRLIADLDQLCKLRNKVVHTRSDASGEEAELALNSVQRLILAIEERLKR